jgi:hypothetical protein
MSTQIKLILSAGIISGIIYAGLLAGSDYSDGQDFRIWRFVFNALLFGIFMGLMTYYFMKKKGKSEI